MAITKLPPAPTPTDTTAEFNAKSFAFVAALDGFVIEANALEALADAAAKSTAADAETTAVASNAAVLAAKSAVTDAATASEKSALAVTAATTAAADAATASTDSAAAVSAAKSAVADADTASVAAKAAVSAAQATAADMARTSASSDAAVSAANYKGEWSLMTGALDIPASVSHLNKVWILKHAVSKQVPTPSSKNQTVRMKSLRLCAVCWFPKKMLRPKTPPALQAQPNCPSAKSN